MIKFKIKSDFISKEAIIISKILGIIEKFKELLERKTGDFKTKTSIKNKKFKFKKEQGLITATKSKETRSSRYLF